MRILVVDDDPAVCGSIGRALRLESYDVETASDGQAALKALNTSPPDAVVLDLQLPDIDGLEVCRRMRAAGDDTPVLMLTARDAVDDRVQGLDAGADDYLVKPFALAELLARLRALLRRRSDGEGETLRFGDLSLDLATREARSGHARLHADSDRVRLVRAPPSAPATGVRPARSFSSGCGDTSSTRGRTPSLSTSATCDARPRREASRAASTRFAVSATS